jgi:hypothetical protein
VNVSTLICHRDVATGLSCLDAFVRCVPGTTLVVHDDGTLTDEDVLRLAVALPVAGVLRRRQADEMVRELLARYPACARARKENVLMLKLFDVALTSNDADIRYCDSDVLFFRPTSGLFSRGPDRPAAVFMQDSNHAYALRPWHLLQPAAIRLPKYLNSGLFMFRRDRFDLEYLEWLLSRDAVRGVFSRIAVWAEQTCWAALAYRAGCGLWDATRIAVVDAGWRFDRRAVAAHFVSSSRDRLADVLRRTAGTDPAGSEPVAVPVVESRRCTAFELGKSQIFRRLRRACGY